MFSKCYCAPSGPGSDLGTGDTGTRQEREWRKSLLSDTDLPVGETDNEKSPKSRVRMVMSQ